MKIFISIASYRDILLRLTIVDCYKKAKYKDSLVFGIVDQCFEYEIPKFSELSFNNQIKYFNFHPVLARGACFPRHLCQTLYSDEDYILQIDSHTVFDENWDEKLLDSYSDLKKESNSPVISTHPPPFTVDPKNILEYNTNPYHGVHYLVPVIDKSFQNQEHFDDYTITCLAEGIDTNKTLEGYLIGAGFLFTTTSIIEKVPYDPFLFFLGEESSYAIRLWTNGYDIFHTPEVPLYHCYNRTYGTLMWEEKDIDKMRDQASWERDLYSKNRLKEIVTGKLDSIYGLGKKRSLEDYIKFSGIDYLNKQISEVIIHS